MFSWISKGRANNGTVGIESRPDGIAVAHITPSAEGSPTLASCDFIRCAPEADRAALLAEHVQSLGLKNTPCNLVLPLADYSLQLSDAPAVEPAELRDAIRWQIKDLLPMPLEEAVIDAFPLPKDTGRDAMVYAVAAQRQKVDEHIALAKQAGLSLNAIDIAELTLRNVGDLFNAGERSMALVLIEPGRASINLVRAGQLYLSRQFDIAWRGGLMDELPSDQLSLELQRSLDYFERQMRQVPPQQIYLFGEGITDDKIPADMRQNLTAAVTAVDLETLMPLPAAIDNDILPRCVGAIGAALRVDEEAAQ